AAAPAPPAPPAQPATAPTGQPATGAIPAPTGGLVLKPNQIPPYNTPIAGDNIQPGRVNVIQTVKTKLGGDRIVGLVRNDTGGPVSTSASSSRARTPPATSPRRPPASTARPNGASRTPAKTKPSKPTAA